ncbi:hypothetical protein D1BOALGB6SA_9445 [Olavius sp. associated proteobacterium Delta 1]|nr:hypothetical protein D1BOALGB6SA_9445 [Olavius sp. associated proteobacterium Delta 1]
MILLEKVARWINTLPETTWLDAACGDGQLADLVETHRRMLGLDIEQIRLVRACDHPYRLLVQASVTDLPFADQSLGGIVSIETLEHVEEISLSLAECARCLEPKGHLIISMPSVTLRSLWAMYRLRAPVYCCAEQHVRELSPITLKGFRHRFQTFKWFEKELSRCGFKVVRRSGVGFVFPMWQGGLSWMEHGMNLLYRENLNRIFSQLPFFRQFPYYRLYLAHLDTA